MPNVGLIRLRDAETGETIMLDTASRRNRRLYEEYARATAKTREGLFRRLRLNPIRLSTGEDFVEPLKKFFRYREKRKGSRKK